MSTAQTEARAVESVRKWLDGGCSSWGLPSQQIEMLLSALAAKDAEIAALKKEAADVVRPFAGVAELVDLDTEGFGDSDTFDLMFNDFLFDRFTLGHFRVAHDFLDKMEG